jgi:hypothetical protein
MRRLFWLILAFWTIFPFSGCSPGKGGGGGVSVGTSLTQVYFSLEQVTGPTSTAPPLLAPSLLPWVASRDPFIPLQFRGTIETAILGISQVRLRYTGGSTCNSSELLEVKAQGPFFFSLTEAVIRPEIPPLPITRSALLCEIRLKGNEGDPDRPEKGPPFLFLQGTLEDGRGLMVVSSRAEDFKIRWTSQALTATVQEIRLRFPYPEWIAFLRASDFNEPDAVAIRDDRYGEVLREILDRLEQSAEGKQGKGCNPPPQALLEKNPRELCEKEE